MAKKSTSKKTLAKAGRKPGKIAFIDDQLQSGKFTKAEIAANLAKEFGMPEKTAVNTVNWAASTMQNRTGKVSNHLPKAGKDESKPVKAKKPAKKKAAMPKRKPVVGASASIPETNAAPAA